MSETEGSIVALLLLFSIILNTLFGLFCVNSVKIFSFWDFLLTLQHVPKFVTLYELI